MRNEENMKKNAKKNKDKPKTESKKNITNSPKDIFS